MPSADVRNHPLGGFQTWRGMWKRCTNPKAVDYKYYGGRGISVDPAWRLYENFLNDMGYKPGPEYELDRIDNNFNYTKNNCRWVTHSENVRNQSSTIMIERDGHVRTMSEWAEILGFSQSGFCTRIKRWGIEEAFTRPRHNTGPKKRKTDK